MPVREAICRSRLLVTVSSPVSVPAIVGAYLTLMMQLSAGASVAAQVLVCVKSPSVATPIPVMTAVPLLLSTTSTAGLLLPIRVPGNVCTLGVSVAPAAVPVADRLMIWLWVPPPALPVNVTVPVRPPAAVGVKFTVRLQLLPAGTPAQSPLTAKSPLVATLEITRVLLPVFVIVMAWPLLVLETIWLPKSSWAGTTRMPGGVPVPVRPTDCGLFDCASVTVSVPVRAPATVGVNRTLTLHVAIGAIIGQLSMALKSPLA